MLHRVAIFGVAGGWEILDRVQGRFRMKMLRIPRMVTNWEVKFWTTVKQTGQEELVRLLQMSDR